MPTLEDSKIFMLNLVQELNGDSTSAEAILMESLEVMKSMPAEDLLEGTLDYTMHLWSTLSRQRIMLTNLLELALSTDDVLDSVRTKIEAIANNE